MDLAEGDYLEHWENGIGKVLRVGDSSITISFMSCGKTEVPIEGTKLFKKLNPQGLWAHFFENPNQVRELVKEDPTEIVKLLILDLDPARGKKIERSQLKTLLTGASPDVRGWRRDFTLVQNWGSWWKNASKRLKDDPCFDMSQKTTLALREEAISKIDTLHEQFLNEKQLDKRISISEQLLQACDKGQHEAILNDIRDFFSSLFQSSRVTEFLGLAVYNAIDLQNKGFQIPGFADNSYLLSLHGLLRGKLPTKKLFRIYQFFSKLPKQNPNDHLILFLYVNKKIKEKVVKNFKKKDGLAKGVRIGDNKEVLTPNQLRFLSGFGPDMEEILSQAIIEMSVQIPEPFLSSFLLAALLSNEINEAIKRIAAASIVRQRMDWIIYQYLLKVEPSPDKEGIPFLYDFLKAIGTAKAEWALRNILLTRSTANQRPSVYLAALKVLVSDSGPLINAEQKESLVFEVKKLLSTDAARVNMDLLMQINNVASTIHDFEEISESISDEDVVSIAKTRQAGIRRRREAVKLLAARGLKNQCLVLTQDLIGTIQSEEFVLLQEILKYSADMPSVKNLLRLFLEKADIGEAELCGAFVSFVKRSELSKTFSEVILLDQPEQWQQKHCKKVMDVLLQDESLMREVVRFGLERMLSQGGLPGNFKDNFMLYLSPFMDKVVDEMRIIVIEKVRSSKADRENLIDQHAMEMKAQAYEFEAMLHDATLRTSQRYEQYLKRLIPVLGQIEAIQQKLGSLEIPNKDINDKLTVVREDIQWVLKILKVIDREQN